MTKDPRKYKDYSFVQKVWIVGGIFALIVVILLLLKTTFNVLILLFAGALIATFFRGLGDQIAKKINISTGISTAIAIIGTLLIIIGLSWLVGSESQKQLSQLDASLPATYANARAYLNQYWLGREVVERWSEARTDTRISTIFTQFFRTSFGVIGDFYVILLVGIFFSASPKLYTNGIKKLVPPRGRKKANEVLKHLGHGLKLWLAGKIFAMFVIFILTAIALKILGMPMWLALAIIAGLLNFIPNFGPMLAMIPALLVALTKDPQLAFIIAGVYIFIQLLESNFITPKVQQHLIKIPPALIITSQIIVATFAGIWGVIFATPIILAVIILVQDLYVKPTEKKHDVDL